VEPLWSSLKGVELANLAGEGLDEVTAAAERCPATPGGSLVVGRTRMSPETGRTSFQ
jgi:hypothetical protein